MKSVYLSIIFFSLLGIISCQPGKETYTATLADSTVAETTSPYLTHDNNGNAVLCWTAKGPSDSLYRLKYAIFDSEVGKFKATVTVPGSAGTSVSAESMNKVAFKSDGTVIAVFAKRFENEKNPYAGAIYYSTSFDNGKNWTKENYLHSDTSHTYGRSFFDLSVLKNGEIAAIWLDGRYGKSIKGSALFFSATSKGKGFGVDTCLEKGTCECCRTALLTDKQGAIHIAYRSITYPAAMLGKQVRDMVYTVSKDNGRTFLPVKALSKDNWAIEGCPHSGPSLAAGSKGINAVWFTSGGTPGIYYSNSSYSSTAFSPRSLLSAAGRHPQLIPISDDKLAFICEESSSVHHEAGMEIKSHAGMNMNHNHSPASASKIILRILSNGNEERSIAVTSGKFAEHHAVATRVGNKILAAWVREEKGKETVYYSLIKL
ncbi:hypothetical protein [Rubrolithibacter danxiaensis]|uniref:hypothetical protein n=1 Tax=Rubrolithibacter danxiaensis TaxID=3390805 RepID=UPI003BF83FE9